MEDKRVLVVISLVKYEVANELMQRRPENKAHKSITFLSHLSNQDLETLNIHDRIDIIIRAKKLIEKHKLMNIVKSLAKEMKIEVEGFYKKSQHLFDKGLPSFWYNKDSLFNKDDYDNLLAQQRMNCDKFQDMEGTFKGEDILNKLEDDLTYFVK